MNGQIFEINKTIILQQNQKFEYVQGSYSQLFLTYLIRRVIKCTKFFSSFQCNRFIYISLRYVFIQFCHLTQQQRTRETSLKNKSSGFRNFACIDGKNNKFYLNLEDLAIYEMEKISFISAITKKIPGDNTVDISPEPIIIHNEISYFLLLTSSCSPEILKLLYMLSHSIYISVELLSQFEINIGKAIDTAYSWSIRNFLYITSQQGSGTSDEFQTAAESKSQKFMNQSSMKGKKLKILYDPKLQTYFTQIFRTAIIDESSNDLENLAKSQLLELGQINRFYTYQSILKGCTRMLTSNKPLPIKQFYELNTNIAMKKLLEESIKNFNNFLSSYLEDGGLVSQKEIKNVLLNAKQAAISVLAKHEGGWLGEEGKFQSVLKELKEKLQSESKHIFQTIKSRNKEYAFRVLYDKKEMKTKKLLGNQEIDQFQISFSTYADIIRDQIDGLLEEIKSNGLGMDEGKLINNSQDLLRNLQIRIGIYQQKKASFEGAIELAKQEQNSLNQLVCGLKIKLKPYEIIDN